MSPGARSRDDPLPCIVRDTVRNGLDLGEITGIAVTTPKSSRSSQPRAIRREE